MKPVCERAAVTDIAQMTALWKTAFEEDTDEDIAAFMDRFADTGYVVRADNRVVTMLFLIPAVLEFCQTRMPMAYIYAGATLPLHRGQGYYRQLIRFVCDDAEKRGIKAVFLRPADDALMHSYRHMGFTVPMLCREEEGCFSSAATSSVTALSASQYRFERNRFLRQADVPFVDWDERVSEYCLTWCRAVRCDGVTALGSFVNGNTVFWECFGGSPSAFESHPFQTENYKVRYIGTQTVVGLLMPLDNAVFDTMPPIYMGYGME